MSQMSPFGKLLWDTAKSCEGRSCEVLDRVLTIKVRAWADELQANEARPEPANDDASGLNKMVLPKGFPNSLSQDRP